MDSGASVTANAENAEGRLTNKSGYLSDKAKAIFNAAWEKLNGDIDSLTDGVAHIVWDDYNVEDSYIKYCLEKIERERVILDVVKWSLEELLKIPEDERSNFFCDGEYCLNPATHAVQDVYEVTNADYARALVPHGEPRRGCDEHPVTQRVYDLNGALIK